MCPRFFCVLTRVNHGKYLFADSDLAAPYGVALLTHDLTQKPFLLRPADLLFCRLVLAHQRDPFALVRARWVVASRRYGVCVE